MSKSKLAELRRVLYEEETTLDVVLDEYKAWVSEKQYLIFEQKRHRSPVRQIASFVPKRGNPKYAWKVHKMWREFTLPFEYQQKLDAEMGYTSQTNETTTNVLFLTLTWDVNFCDWKTAWNAISYFWNLFTANLRRKYGRALTARAYESTEKGFPHIHCILYFENSQFPTFLRRSKKQKRYVWRIPFPEVEKLRGLWHSFIDVQGMVSLAEGLNYLGKYVTKASNYESDDLLGKGLATLATTWAFGKRSYSLGRKFKEAIFEKYVALDLTRISLTQTVSEQMTLEFKLLRDCQPSLLKPFFEKWTMRGIIKKSLLKTHGGIPRGCFSFGLCEKQKQFVEYYFGGRKVEDVVVQKPWIMSAYAD
jgi:hypothetical protein